MQRIPSVKLESAQGRTLELLKTVEGAFGVIPNTARMMANSPSVLEGFLGLSQAMAGAKIGPVLLHQVKLATSESNTCDYCKSILTHLGNQGGISAETMLEGRRGSASDARTDAALKFAAAVLETHGRVGDDELKAVRGAGFDDAEIVEIVAAVVTGCYTNFLNNVADTLLDIPRAEALGTCSPIGASR